MRALKMDVRDTSWVSKTIDSMSKITLLLEDTCMHLDAKKITRKCMLGVQPYSLRKRLLTLMESFDNYERAAAKNLKVWKTLG